VWALVLAACAPSPALPPTQTPIPSISTAWGDSQVLARAPVFSPPAVMPERTGLLTAAFVAIARDSVLTLYRDDWPIPTRVLARDPYALTLHPASDLGLFALWMQPDVDGRGGLLHVARLSADGQSTLGAVRVSDVPTVRYSALSQPDGGLVLVWHIPSAPEPVLYLTRIDGQGRPRTPAALPISGEHPTLLAHDGQLWLYTRAPSGEVWRAPFIDDGLGDAQTVAGAPDLAPDSALLHLSIGLDSTHRYLFWNALTADGSSEVWWSSGALNGNTPPSPPQPFHLRASDAPAPALSFNQSGAQAAIHAPDGIPVMWAQAAHGQSDVLPVAIQWAGQVGVAYVSGGQVLAAQAISTDAPPLIAPPSVAYDAERDLFLAWWRAGDETAELITAYSRR
jgi:hypothetical protein